MASQLLSQLEESRPVQVRPQHLSTQMHIPLLQNNFTALLTPTDERTQQQREQDCSSLERDRYNDRTAEAKRAVTPNSAAMLQYHHHHHQHNQQWQQEAYLRQASADAE